MFQISPVLFSWLTSHTYRREDRFWDCTWENICSFCQT